jgi:prepilin-type N-terminal cleavage/methylation domain-containing protein
MKNKKGFTLIEVLICIAIVGIILAIAIPNIKVAVDKNKKKNSRVDVVETRREAERELQQMRENPAITITKISSQDMFTFYRIRDNGHEYLLVYNHGSGNIAITPRW